MKNRIYFIISILVFFTSCNDDTRDVIELPREDNFLTKSSNSFTEIRNVECSEPIHLNYVEYPGALFTKESITNGSFLPLNYPLSSAVTLTNTLSGTEPKELKKRSFSSYYKLLKEQISKASFPKKNKDYFSINQFSNYEELKSVFGSDINVYDFFNMNPSRSSIEMNTGIVVQFYKKSFKVEIKTPDNLQDGIPLNIINKGVYVNSITYGKMGIFIFETNELPAKAINMISKIMKNPTSPLSSDEKLFFDQCDFKTYILGGNKNFGGFRFENYVTNLKKNDFSRSLPGVPLFCTFNHLKDNSPVSIKFKYSIKRAPLYVEMKHEGNNLNLYFYRSRSKKIPTIAPPELVFKIREETRGITHDYGNRVKQVDEKRSISIQNTGRRTFLKALSDIDLEHREFCDGEGLVCPGVRHPGVPLLFTNTKYTLLPDKSSNYIIVGNSTVGDLDFRH